MANKDKKPEAKKSKMASAPAKIVEGRKLVAPKKTKATHRVPQALPCVSCGDRPHAQDGIYGAGKRLHTMGTKNAKRTCTVCGVKTNL